MRKGSEEPQRLLKKWMKSHVLRYFEELFLCSLFKAFYDIYQQSSEFLNIAKVKIDTAEVAEQGCDTVVPKTNI